jgi:hypothetical protein
MVVVVVRFLGQRAGDLAHGSPTEQRRCCHSLYVASHLQGALIGVQNVDSVGVASEELGYEGLCLHVD